MPDSTKRLWRAVLKQAVQDLMLPVVRTKGEVSVSVHSRSALHWLRGTRDAGPGSFGFVCTVLSIDPDRARRNLLARRELRRLLETADG